jgi:hypothetical protein
MITNTISPLVRRQQRPDGGVDFLDLGDGAHRCFGDAHRASMRAVLALTLIDAGMLPAAAEATAAQLVTDYTIVPRGEFRLGIGL